MTTLDPVEREYLVAIDRADTDEAYDLAIGLAQYRELYCCSPETESQVIT